MNAITRTASDMTTRDMNTLSLDALRADFDRNGRRNLSMPIAGTVMWTAAGIASLFLPERIGLLVLVAAVSSIYPLALLIARFTGENMKDNRNPLSRLMMVGIIMANLPWMITFNLFAHAPQLIPMTIGIAAGLHWILFGWIIQHKLGLLHSVGRTLGLGATVILLPAQFALPAACAVVVLAYLLTLPALLSRPIPALDEASLGNLQPTTA